MEPSNSAPSSANTSGETYYGWWIVFAAFLNLFLVVGVIFYGFPAFYPYFIQDLHFTRAQLTQGFLLGFLDRPRRRARSHSVRRRARLRLTNLDEQNHRLLAIRTSLHR
jgi:hypothetical protein